MIEWLRRKWELWNYGIDYTELNEKLAIEALQKWVPLANGIEPSSYSCSFCNRYRNSTKYAMITCTYSNYCKDENGKECPLKEKGYTCNSDHKKWMEVTELGDKTPTIEELTKANRKGIPQAQAMVERLKKLIKKDAYYLNYDKLYHLQNTKVVSNMAFQTVKLGRKTFLDINEIVDSILNDPNPSTCSTEEKVFDEENIMRHMEEAIAYRNSQIYASIWEKLLNKALQELESDSFNMKKYVEPNKISLKQAITRMNREQFLNRFMNLLDKYRR
jgi:hypothetical protein